MPDPRELTPDVASDIQKLSPGSIIEVFTLDATNIGGSIYNFHSGSNQINQAIIFNGVTYSMWPIEATGFEITSKGTSPNPKLKVANISGIIGALCKDLEDLINAKLIRRKFFAKYLDAINFPSGQNPYANFSNRFSDEIWYVERKVTENPIFIEFSLSSSMDVQGVKIPLRQVLTTCTSEYRKSECGYVGTNYFDINDNPTNSAGDICGKRVTSCEKRFGQYAVLNFGGFPGAGRL